MCLMLCPHVCKLGVETNVRFTNTFQLTYDAA